MGPIIGPLLGPLLASTITKAAEQGKNSLRKTAGEIGRDIALVMAAGIAGAMGAICLTGAAFFALTSQRLSPAESLGIIGAVYLLAAGTFFLLRRRTS